VYECQRAAETIGFDRRGRRNVSIKKAGLEPGLDNYQIS
jgi:hypothetical protein